MVMIHMLHSRTPRRGIVASSFRDRRAVTKSLTAKKLTHRPAKNNVKLKKLRMSMRTESGIIRGKYFEVTEAR